MGAASVQALHCVRKLGTGRECEKQNVRVREDIRAVSERLSGPSVPLQA